MAASLLRCPSSPRLARFVCTGGAAAGVQLGLLHLWTARGGDALLANLVAFLLAAQVNFALSTTFTWSDRPAGGRSGRIFLRRWVAFHCSIAGTALLNQTVFALARGAMPNLDAAALGIAAAAVANFVLLDRVIFRVR